MPPGARRRALEARERSRGRARARDRARARRAARGALRGSRQEHDRDSFEASVIRVARRDYEKAVRVPAELRAEMTRAGSLGYQAWLKAREASDYAIILPQLERKLELDAASTSPASSRTTTRTTRPRRSRAGHEDGRGRGRLRRFKERLVQMVARSRRARRRLMPLRRSRSSAARASRSRCSRRGGWTTGRGGSTTRCIRSRSRSRMTTSGSRRDSTRTTSVGSCRACTSSGTASTSGRSIRATPHVACRRRVVGHPRVAEPDLGEPRRPSLSTWRYFYPLLQESCPASADVPLETFQRALNKVKPTLVRVEADEVTYCLHIILRFELEREMLAGRLDVRDLPEAFDAKMREYLGLQPPDVVEGVLQDVHWSDMSFGYFPTYALGNVISVQLWERAGPSSATSTRSSSGASSAAARVAAREHPPVRPHVRAAGAARAVGRRADRRRAVSRVPARKLEALDAAEVVAPVDPA